MEASTLQAPAGLARNRIAIGTPLLRLRSDDQLVALFRAGHEEAFRAIHDRYQKRLLAYARQMLPRGQDAEDALQDVFVRAYSGLRSSERQLALRAWLFRVAHNRCIDELRRPTPPPPEVLQLVGRAVHDPVAEADCRESLRRLIVDVRRLPEQQRSALLMREMGGMSYADLACSLGTSVPAVKSLLVRARIALAQAAAARDTACSEIQQELAGAHDRGVRPNATAKRHMRDCSGCRSFRRELRSVNRQLAALLPLGPIAMLAKTLGLSSGAGAGGSATAGGAGAGGASAAGGGAAAIGGASGGGAVASGALVVGSGHVATLLAAAVATAGGAVAISAPPAQSSHARAAITRNAADLNVQPGALAPDQASSVQAVAATAAGASLAAQAKAKSDSQATIKAKQGSLQSGRSSSRAATTAPATSSSSDSSSTGITDPGSSVTATLNSGSDPSETGASSTSGDSTTSSTGSSPQSGDGSGTSSSTSGSTSSGSPSSGPTATTSSGGSSGTGSPSGTGSGTGGSTSNTANSPSGTSSGTGSGSSTGTTSATTPK